MPPYLTLGVKGLKIFGGHVPATAELDWPDAFISKLAQQSVVKATYM